MCNKVYVAFEIFILQKKNKTQTTTMSCRDIFARRVTACKGSITTLRVGKILGLDEDGGGSGGGGSGGRDVGFPLFNVQTQDVAGGDGPETLNQGDDVLEFKSNTLQLSVGEKKGGNVNVNVDLPRVLSVVDDPEISFTGPGGSGGSGTIGAQQQLIERHFDGDNYWATISGSFRVSGVNWASPGGYKYLRLYLHNLPPAVRTGFSSGVPGGAMSVVYLTAASSFQVPYSPIGIKDVSMVNKTTLCFNINTDPAVVNGGQVQITYTYTYLVEEET